MMRSTRNWRSCPTSPTRRFGRIDGALVFVDPAPAWLSAEAKASPTEPEVKEILATSSFYDAAHVRPPKISLRKQRIVGPAHEPKILDRRRPAERKRLFVVNLEPRSFRASPSIHLLERAPRFVALPYRSPYVCRYVATVHMRWRGSLCLAVRLIDPRRRGSRHVVMHPRRRGSIRLGDAPRTPHHCLTPFSQQLDERCHGELVDAHHVPVRHLMLQ